MEKQTDPLISVIHDTTSFRRRMYGPNLIDVPVKPYMKLLFEEVRWKISLLYWLFYDALECFKWYFFQNPGGVSNWTICLFVSLFRSSTHSMCSSCSASPCGWLIIIMFTLYVYSLSPFCPSVSHFMRSARWACSGILNLIIIRYVFSSVNNII